MNKTSKWVDGHANDDETFFHGVEYEVEEGEWWWFKEQSELWGFSCQGL